MGNMNLARIPEDWGLTYGSGPQIIFLDSSVLGPSGNPTIRLEPHTAADMNQYRECDGKYYAVKPGDHVVLKVWIKVDPNYVYQGSPNGWEPQWSGGRLGIDYIIRRPDGNVCVAAGRPTDAESEGSFVHWGTAGWVEKVWDFIVPDTLFSKCGSSQDPGVIDPPVQIAFILPWLDVRPVAAAGKVWFADAELYINPSATTPPSSCTAVKGANGEITWFCVPDAQTQEVLQGSFGGCTVTSPTSEYDPVSGILKVQCVGCEIQPIQYWVNSVNVLSGVQAGWTQGDRVCPVGQHYDVGLNACVQDIPPTPPTPYKSTYIAYASGVSQRDIAVLRVFGHWCLPEKVIGFYDWCGPHLARLIRADSMKKAVRSAVEWLVRQYRPRQV